MDARNSSRNEHQTSVTLGVSPPPNPVLFPTLWTGFVDRSGSRDDPCGWVGNRQRGSFHQCGEPGPYGDPEPTGSPTLVCTPDPPTRPDEVENRTRDGRCSWGPSRGCDPFRPGWTRRWDGPVRISGVRGRLGPGESGSPKDTLNETRKKETIPVTGRSTRECRPYVREGWSVLTRGGGERDVTGRGNCSVRSRVFSGLGPSSVGTQE